jgi:hypothetical protein
LRIAKRAGKYYILGKWLIEWIEGGEVRRRSTERGLASGADDLAEALRDRLGAKPVADQLEGPT